MLAGFQSEDPPDLSILWWLNETNERQLSKSKSVAMALLKLGFKCLFLVFVPFGNGFLLQFPMKIILSGPEYLLHYIFI